MRVGPMKWTPKYRPESRRVRRWNIGDTAYCLTALFPVFPHCVNETKISKCGLIAIDGIWGIVQPEKRIESTAIPLEMLMTEEEAVAERLKY